MLKKSIRWKITIIFVLIILCLIGSIMIFNNFFLENLYINERKNVLKNTYKMLDSGIIEAYNKGFTLADLVKSNDDINDRYDKYGSKFKTISYNSSLGSIVKDLLDTYNVSIILVDKDENMYSLYNDNTRLNNKIITYIVNEQSKNYKILEETGNYKIFINSYDDRFPKNNQNENHVKSNSKPNRRRQFIRNFDVRDLECFGYLSDNQTMFLMTSPLISIKEPLILFNNTFIFISIIVCLLGSIIVYIVSNFITIPIIKLAEISKGMSNLDFTCKYEGKNNDEIGILGNSMNEMSNKLEKSIMDLKNANINLKKDIEKKVQLDKMRQDFVANVSHELKTPIALILGYAEGLQTGIAKTKEDIDFYTEVIIDESNKMNNMVKQLLNLTQIERGMSNIEIERFDLLEVLIACINKYELVLKQNDIVLINTIKEPIYVWADEFKTEEVITNYLTNAIHHVDSNKIIKISYKKIANNKIRFMIFNSGENLSEENLNRVFEKFYKIDKARTREYGGTGLGLSIVKAIAMEHNVECGAINVLKEETGMQGIIFYFDFLIK